MPDTKTAMSTKIKSILISQPKPESGKSPYYDLGEKYGIKIEFRQFIQVEGVSRKDIQKQRVKPSDYSAVIFTSRNAIDHFFRICDEMKVKMSQDTKYFCISEAIALYLQKYIQYRKRKVIFGDGKIKALQALLLKHKKNEKFLLPCSDIRRADLPEFMEENEFDFRETCFYKTVASDLSDLKDVNYDMIVFFSPAGVKSLFKNFPDFEQNETRIAAFGLTTERAVVEAGLRLDVKAPIPKAPSMTKAIELYLLDQKNSK